MKTRRASYSTVVVFVETEILIHNFRVMISLALDGEHQCEHQCCCCIMPTFNVSQDRELWQSKSLSARKLTTSGPTGSGLPWRWSLRCSTLPHLGPHLPPCPATVSPGPESRLPKLPPHTSALSGCSLALAMMAETVTEPCRPGRRRYGW